MIVILQEGKLKDGDETPHQQTKKKKKKNQGEIQRKVSSHQTPHQPPLRSVQVRLTV